MALLTTAICLLFCFVGVNAAYPFVRATRQREENDDVEREISRAMIQNQNDSRKLEAMKTRDGQILNARQRGFIFPDERKLRIPGAR